MLIPALLTRMSILPASLAISVIAAGILSNSVKSKMNGFAYSPISSQAFKVFSLFRPITYVVIPSLQSFLAVANPSPALPPVTIAVKFEFISFLIP